MLRLGCFAHSLQDMTVNASQITTNSKICSTVVCSVHNVVTSQALDTYLPGITYSVVPLKRGQISSTYSQYIPHSSPVMGCLLGVQTLINILPQFQQRCFQYSVILDHVITALDCTKVVSILETIISRPILLTSLTNAYTYGFVWEVINPVEPNPTSGLTKPQLKSWHQWVITSHRFAWIPLFIHALIWIKIVLT